MLQSFEEVRTSLVARHEHTERVGRNQGYTDVISS